MKKYYILLLSIFFGYSSISQNTIGVLRNDAGSYNGYTLLAPLSSTQTYLINNCGQVVHEWTSTFTPSASVYLLENGNLLRTGKISNDDIQFGGVGGKIELFDWDGNLLWEYTYSTTEVSQHHDIYPLSNGNVLMLAVTTMTQAEAIQAGRDPSQLEQSKLFNEQIVELEPVMGTDQANIVWEWNINDHLIQDFDNTKDNFGVIADNEQLLDINYLNSDKSPANWLHINSIQYNATLDQIVMSSRILSEIYIIDHSTTTAEASLHSGGTYGKGGDFLYRWGNLEAYDHGTPNDRTLFGQHYPHWIADGLTDEGKLIIYNNGGARVDAIYSSIDIIDPPVSSPGVYTYDTASGYLPVVPEWQYTDPDEPTNFFSAILSSGQRLPNGNTLICDGDSGYFFEIDTNNNIVWEYINPDTTNGILTQGDSPSFNMVFRALRFDETYAAFNGRDLTPGDPIELDFDISSCQILSVDNYSISNQVSIYPNPTSDMISLSTDLNIDKIEVFNVYGKLILSERNKKTISLKNISTGIYFMKFYSDGKFGNKKFIKQ